MTERARRAYTYIVACIYGVDLVPDRGIFEYLNIVRGKTIY